MNIINRFAVNCMMWVYLRTSNLTTTTRLLLVAYLIFKVLRGMGQEKLGGSFWVGFITPFFRFEYVAMPTTAALVLVTLMAWSCNRLHWKSFGNGSVNMATVLLPLIVAFLLIEFGPTLTAVGIVVSGLLLLRQWNTFLLLTLGIGAVLVLAGGAGGSGPRKTYIPEPEGKTDMQGNPILSSDIQEGLDRGL